MLGGFFNEGLRIKLDSRRRKALWLGAASLASLAYLGFALRSYVAAHYSERPDLASLQTAVRLDPGNAEYSDRLGRYYSLAQDPHGALAAYKSAVQQSPHRARYWLELAAAYQVLGDDEGQRQALEQAVRADPRTPEVAWEAANFHLVRGENDAALREFRVVLQNDPYLPPAALERCWRIRPDVDAILRDLLPASPQAHLDFLNLLIAKKETASAAKVWARLAELHQPFEARYMFDYIRYLIGEEDVEQARVVWQQAAGLTGLSAYLPSPDNLIVNGDFSLDVLNGGFDWLYQKQPEVSLALDPTDFHTGHRSLNIGFDGQGIEDAGIQQLIPVQPNTAYDFSAYFKAKDMQGAGGLRIAIQDFYTQTTYFASDDLKDADFWKLTGGSFTTGPETRLLALHVQRSPAGSPIRGQLWLDNIRLADKQPVSGRHE